jgi:DNA-binding CsgD family transcriptional regulator
MRQPTSTAPPPPRRRRAAARSARATRRAPRRRAPGPRAITPAADAHRRGPARSGVGTVGETRVPGDGLSQYVERIYGREVLASGEGGIGYLLKDRVGDVGEWVDALGRVAPGGTVLDPQVVSAVMARQEPVERLTARERDVLGLMAEGRSNAAIAAALFVTEKAVGKHVNSIFTKLDLPVAPDDNRRVLAVLAWLGV